jgi:chromosome segregation protein
VVSTLEADAARLSAEIAAADAEEASTAPERDAAAAARRALDTEQSELRARWASVLADDTPDDAATKARARSELLERAAAREQQDMAGLDSRVASLEQRHQAAAVRADLIDRSSAESDDTAAALAAALAACTTELEHASAHAEAAQGAVDEAEQARHRTAARAEALDRALRDLQGAGGRELLREVDGVVGSLLDLVEIDPGWEAAFEAAAGAGVAAVVVDGRQSAQAALATLRDRGVTGAVLAPRHSARPDATADLPAGTSAQPVRAHVRARHGESAAESVLNALLSGAVRVDGWEEAIDLSIARDDLVVVTPEGDRFAATGWRVRSATSLVTAAAVEEAESRAAEAAHIADIARNTLSERRIALARARDARTAAEREVDRHTASRAAAETDRSRTGEEKQRLADELNDARQARTEAEQRLADVRAEAARLAGSLPVLDEALAAWQELATRRRAALEAQQAFEVRVAGVAERRRVLMARHTEVERRLGGHAEERAHATERRERLEAEGTALTRLDAVVEQERARLEAILDTLRHDYQEQVDAVRAGGERLEQLRRDRHTSEQRLDAVRARTRALDLETNEVSLRSETLLEHIHRDLQATPDELQSLPTPEIPEGATLITHAEELERKLVALGPVNPLALEELSTLEERHKELEVQVDDVRGARRELHEVVRTLDQEIVESFAAAAADVNEHFSALVALLFPGGIGRMVLTDPEDLLNTGVEIEVRPAGRNVRRVSLLSGGERSMAALAFLFAVFRSRPSPFYMMDEVEAALDDVNLHRFLSLVREFRDEAQLLIVSHQKRTMETGDALYGVTMAPGGSSQVVSQKVEKEPLPEPELA